MDNNQRMVEANKAFTMRGTDYQPGDPVDVTGLEDRKVAQLLNQRYLRPIQPNSGSNTPPDTA